MGADQLGVGSEFDRTQTACVNDAESTWTERVQVIRTESLAETQARALRAVYPWVAHRPASLNQPTMSSGATCFSASPSARICSARSSDRVLRNVPLAFTWR